MQCTGFSNVAWAKTRKIKFHRSSTEIPNRKLTESDFAKRFDPIFKSLKGVLSIEMSFFYLSVSDR